MIVRADIIIVIMMIGVSIDRDDSHYYFEDKIWLNRKKKYKYYVNK